MRIVMKIPKQIHSEEYESSRAVTQAIGQAQE